MKEIIVFAAFVISILAANLFPDTAPPPPEAHHVAQAPHGPLHRPLQGPG